MSNNIIVERASEYWVNRYQSPYTYIHSGNIKLRMDRESVMNGSKVIVFKDAISNNIKNALFRGFGFAQIRENSEIVLGALKAAEVIIPEGYLRNNSIMYIEDRYIYVYEDGMNKAVKI